MKPVLVREQDMIVGTLDTQGEAESAVRRFLDAGVPAAQLSILTRGAEARAHAPGDVTVGEEALRGAGAGAWVGGLVGLVTGAAFIWVPVIGPLVVLGALASGSRYK